MDSLTEGTVLNFSFRLKIEKGEIPTGYSKYNAGSLTYLIRNKNIFTN